jgi:serine/threonine protein kinase
MSWINSRQFTISNRNGRHYVFRRNNAGNTEINIPAHIVSKGQAIAWLKAHPNKVANPTRYRAKGGRAAPQPSGLKAFERMINGKKMIRFLNKEGKEYFRPAPSSAPKAAPGAKYKYVQPAPKLRPYKKMANITAKNNWDMTCDQLKDSLDSLTPIGKGRQGIVFTAKLRTGNKRPFAVKIAPRDLSAKKRGEPQPVDIEYNIQSAVQDLSPNVVRLYKNMRCTNFITPAQMNMPNVQNSSHYDKSQQGILLMELATGGSLDSWLKKQAKVDDKIMSNIISDILGALFKIQKKYPYFRHNDLHMQNVFVTDRGFLIGDFGWARLKKSGTNPAVNTANGTKTASFWGVGPSTDERYDQHLFLNELLDWAQKHSPVDHPKAIAFLKMAVPPGYRGSKDFHVSEWRLKYGDPCTGLPSLAQILSNSFISGKKRIGSPNLKAAKAALKLVKIKRILSVNLQKAKAKLKAKNLRKPVRLITSLQLRKAREKLKMVARPKPKPRITGRNLRAAKAKLKAIARPRLPSPLSPLGPPKKKVVVPKALLKSAKFNKLVEKIWKNSGAASGANFQNSWNNSRMKAIGVIENRLRANKAAFTPSPPKPRAKTPAKPRAKTPSPAKRLNYRLSPSSGRPKISKNTGRWVYANLHYSMDELKALAASMGVNLRGLRSKANIAKRIFSV